MGKKLIDKLSPSEYYEKLGNAYCRLEFILDYLKKQYQEYKLSKKQETEEDIKSRPSNWEDVKPEDIHIEVFDEFNNKKYYIDDIEVDESKTGTKVVTIFVMSKSNIEKMPN